MGVKCSGLDRIEPPDNDRCPYMAQRAPVSAISEDPYVPKAHVVTCSDGNQERRGGRSEPPREREFPRGAATHGN